MKNNQASSTAYTVLQGLLHVARNAQFQHLVTPRNQEIGQIIMNSSAQGRKRLKQINSALGKRVLKLMERLLLPNISIHYALRKAYIESKVRQAIEDGATQVINLGAGFDTLLYRLSEENPHLNCIEIDHPTTHKVKKDALTTPDTQRANLHFLPVDFTYQSLVEELSKSSCFSSDSPTVCIVEGVLMYLTTDQIYQLFNDLHQALRPQPSHVVFTAVAPPHHHPESYGPLLKLYLKIKGEPLNWLCEEAQLKAFIEPSAFSLKETANSEALRAQFVPEYSGPLHRGEYAGLAVSKQELEGE